MRRQKSSTENEPSRNGRVQSSTIRLAAAIDSSTHAAASGSRA